MSSITKKVGENIRLCRILRNLSQENVADMLQMSSAGYGKIERGNSNISLVRFEEIAKVLSVSPEKLFTFSESRDFFVSEKKEE